MVCIDMYLLMMMSGGIFYNAVGVPSCRRTSTTAWLAVERGFIVVNFQSISQVESDDLRKLLQL